MVREVRRRFHHAPGVARGADTPAFAGEGDKIVVTTIVTPRPGKAVGEDAALQILTKGLANIRLRGVMVALAVELACTGQLMPSLEVFCYGLVEQRALGVARVEEFGFGYCCSWGGGSRAAARMVVRLWPCVRLSCRRVHGATP